MLPLRGLSGFIICLATGSTPLTGLIALSNGPHPLKGEGRKYRIGYMYVTLPEIFLAPDKVAEHRRCSIIVVTYYKTGV